MGRGTKGRVVGTKLPVFVLYNVFFIKIILKVKIRDKNNLSFTHTLIINLKINSIF
jgi:hypothetical protein